MTTNTNRQFLLAARPDGLVKESDFKRVEGPLPDLEDGQVLVRVLMVAVEPALRGTMVEENPGSLNIGDVMGALGAGQVVRTHNPDVAVGDIVQGLFGFADYVVSHPKAFLFAKVPDGVELKDALYVFDTSGLTAYLGMIEIGNPVEGDQVLVSAAAGAVGSLAVQMAKMKGARVVGIAGSDEKCRWLRDGLGADGAINYKTEHVGDAIRSHFPDGIDIYFDNVGGETLDAALGNIRLGSRLILCGRISEYSNTDAPYVPENAANAINLCTRMDRLMLFDHAAEFDDWRRIMTGWMADGKLKPRVDMLDGFENLPMGLIRLFTGENTGKQLIKLGEAD